MCLSIPHLREQGQGWLPVSLALGPSGLEQPFAYDHQPRSIFLSS